MIAFLPFVVMMGSETPKSCCVPSMNGLVADAAFVNSHLPPTPFSFEAKEGKEVHFKALDGRSSGGFYVPGNSGVKSAIIVIHEWWGLNGYIKKEAEKLHDATGYAVLAVDLYEGKVATKPAEAGKLMQSVNADAAKSTLGGAIKALKSGALGAKSTKFGTIGWCFGGGWSLQTALLGGSAVKACVMYYGMPETDQAKLATLKAPVLMLWGKEDKWINAKVVGDFQSAMKKVNKPLEAVGYEADHAFANPSNPKFDGASAADAMKRALALFKKELG